MYQNKRVLALIPARAGSKGLAKKNIKPMNGKPLISWTIEQALKSKHIDRVVVSTEDKEISRIAQESGAEVPFKRPKRLATDRATSIDVVVHALETLEKKGQKYDVLVLLEPTSPLRDIEDIDHAIERLYTKKNAESVVGVARVEAEHPDFLVKLDEGFLAPYTNKQFVPVRRQDVEELYQFEGSFYISKVESLKRHRNFYHERTIGYVLPKWKSYEVDDLSSFVMVEALMEAKEQCVLK